jgi:cytochrome c oxidase subunit 4
VTTAEDHILSYKTLLGVLGILFILTMITIAVSRIDLGWLNIWIALMIASVKSSFVLLFFMHLKYENKIFILTFLMTIFFVAILIGFMFWDVAFRTA